MKSLIKPVRILYLTSPVGALGSGEGGGVETTLMNLTPVLARRGHTVGIVAPAGSQQPSPDVKVHQVAGKFPQYATTATRDAQTVSQSEGVLERMWETALKVQDDYDVIIGINYDWLAYYLTPFFSTPVAHMISLGSQIDEIDKIIEKRYRQYPQRFAVNARAQATTFSFMNPYRVMSLYGGLDLSKYHYNPSPANRLSWVARISPEKGLEDAFAVAQRLNMPLDVCGKMQYQSYWDDVVARYPDVDVTYHGFLNQYDLHLVVGNTKAMLMTHHWIEAFGNTCMEALACGTPVITYDVGGPTEMVEDGVSGYLVPHKNVDALVDAVRRVDQLSRKEVRMRGETFTLDCMAERYERWIQRILCDCEDVNEDMQLATMMPCRG